MTESSPDRKEGGSLLPGTELAAGAYVLTRVLASGPRGAVYLARRREGGTVLIKEMLTPAGLPPEERARRTRRLELAVQLLSRLEHPNLARVFEYLGERGRHYVVMEQVEGFTLATLARWSSQPLPREQVLALGVALCEALQFLHDRGYAWMSPALSASHVMVTRAQVPRLINFGFSDILAGQEPGQAVQVEGMQGISQMLLLLLSPGGDETALQELSPEMAWVFSRLGAQASRPYSGYAELQAALQTLLLPPDETVARPVAARDPLDLPPVRVQRKPRPRLLGLPLPLAGAALALLVALASWAAARLLPHQTARTRAAVYVASGRSLLAFDLQDRRQVAQVGFDTPIEALAATHDGRRLYLCLRGNSRLAVLDTWRQEVLGWVPVTRDPRGLVPDPTGRWLYVLHPEARTISVVELDTAPLPSDPRARVRLRDRMVEVVAVAGSPFTAAVGQLSSAPAPAPAHLPPPGQRLYVGIQKNDSVAAFQVSPLSLLAEARVPAAGPLAVSPDGRTLYAAGPDMVFALDGSSLGTLGRMPEVGGSGIVRLLTSPDGSLLLSLNGSGSLGVLDAASGGLRHTVQLGSP
ncbi:MAG TPA: protein kinase, partial [Candidatus Nitrosotenuis sp.]|nr:protein kinase [Candidatus Nitrosotenuis sp.]